MTTQQEKEEKARKDGDKPDYNADIAKAMGDAAPDPKDVAVQRDNLYLDHNGERIGAGTGVTPGHSGGDQMNIGADSDKATKRGDKDAPKSDPVTPRTDNPAKVGPSSGGSHNR